MIFSAGKYFSTIAYNRKKNSWQVIDSKDADAKKVSVGIKKSFRTITSFKMPYPGTAIATGSEGKSKLTVEGIQF